MIRAIANRAARRVPWTLLLSLYGSLAFGQAAPPATPEPPPTAPTERATLRYNDQLTGTFSAGAVRRTLLNTSHAISYAKGRHFGIPFTGSFVFGKQESRLRERELLLSLSPYYRKDRFRAYAIGAYERSNLRGILNRQQVGAGPGWALVQHDTLNREVLLSNVVLREATYFEDGTTRVVTRNSVRLKLAYGWRPLTFSASTFYQPAFGNRHDYRFSTTATLALRLTTRLAFTTTYVYSYEQRVIEARTRGNTNLTVGVQLSGKQ